MARLTTIQIHQRYETLPVDILRSHRAPRLCLEAALRKNRVKFIFSLSGTSAVYISAWRFGQRGARHVLSAVFIFATRDLTAVLHVGNTGVGMARRIVNAGTAVARL